MGIDNKDKLEGNNTMKIPGNKISYMLLPAIFLISISLASMAAESDFSKKLISVPNVDSYLSAMSLNRASKPVLRFMVPIDNREVYLQELIEQCQALGIEEVLLFTLTSRDYLQNPFVDGEAFNRRMEHLEICADRIKQVGLIFSLNVMQTLGHVYVPEEVEQHFGFERQIMMDGNPTVHPVLDPGCENLRKHLAGIYERYATLKPSRLFIDDDYKVTLKGGFHPARVKEFASIVGCEPTLEAVRSLVFSQDKAQAKDAQKVMWDLINRDLDELALIIRKAVHKVSPKTRIGVMYAGNIKCDIARIAKTLAGEHTPFVRPQMSLYREQQPIANYPGIFWPIAHWQAKFPADFEIFPEIENYPYTPFSKSSTTTFAQIASCFGRGICSPAYNLEDNRNRRTINYLAGKKNQVKRVTEILGGKGLPTGIGTWGLFQTQLELLGLPFYAARKPEYAVIHFGSGLATLEDQEIKKVIKQGAVFDLQAIKVLRQKGLLDELGIEQVSACEREETVKIDFQRSDQSLDDWNIYYFLRNLPDEAWPIKFRAQAEQVLNSYLNNKWEKTTPYAVKWIGPDGQHFGFINFSHEHWPLYAWLNPWMVDIVSNLVEWVQDSEIVVEVENSPRIVIEVCEPVEKSSLLLVLINYSTDSYDNISLAISSQFKDMQFAEIDANGKEHLVKKKYDGDRLHLQIKGSMSCLGVKYLVGR
ncbi:MAG: hypothetical protein U9R60_14435 [Bacteroidota bacterium]|nr:hypothetical protein [Bacteroidota bacterium]